MVHEIGVREVRKGGGIAVTISCMAERGTSAVYTARGQVDGEDWPAVAAALNERMAARRVGQQELARLSGISVSTLRMVQHGASRRVQNKTLEAIARALDWPEDHLIGILVSAGQARPAQGQVEDQVVTVLNRIEQQLQQLGDRLARVEQRIQAEEPGSAPRA
ncbi:hypothetical protein Kisp01_64000 [Kineosporia sp. NBRC 101677]|nr:hypothetical protein Kisp01_64000 [Kineosporia sp. NBRC 101677]